MRRKNLPDWYKVFSVLSAALWVLMAAVLIDFSKRKNLPLYSPKQPGDPSFVEHIAMLETTEIVVGLFTLAVLLGPILLLPFVARSPKTPKSGS